jgi:predicted PurR-regulated permease PerM
MIDNLLYPMLVGNRLKLQSIPSFVSVVGRLLVFGASGLILGPLAVTIKPALLNDRLLSMLTGGREKAFIL